MNTRVHLHEQNINVICSTDQLKENKNKSDIVIDYDNIKYTYMIVNS